MNRIMSYILFLIVALSLTGCSVAPVKQLTREDWLNMTTHTFKNTTVDEVLKSAEKILILSDASEDVSFEHFPNRMTGHRNYFIYAVFAAESGAYNFDIAATQQGDNVTVQTLIGVTSQATGASPTYTPGVQGGWGGMGATATAMPANIGKPINSPEVYDLLYRRMESILYAKEWITCEQLIRAKAKKDNPATYDPTQPVGYYTIPARPYNALCFNADDKIPTNLIE